VEKIARADKRIKAFYNEIKVVSKTVLDQRRKQAESKDDSDQTGFDQWVNDFWLETRIKFNLLTDGDVRSVNFFWRSVLNDVYVIGRARSDFERDSVLANIRATEGVRKIKHHIEVRPIPKKTS
jgi:osmotically-inducible protein OsmY